MRPSSPAQVETVTALVDQALASLGSGRPARARGLLRRAVAHAADTDDPLGSALRARALVTWAAVDFGGEGLERALALLDEADALAAAAVRGGETAHAPTVLTLAVVQRAALLGRAGRWPDSTALYERLDGDPNLPGRAACVVALNLGLGRHQLGDSADALVALHRAEDLAVRHGQPDLRVAAVHNLGVVALARGEVPAALAAMARARELGPDVQPVAARLDHARALMDVGLLDEARPLLGEAALAAHRARGTIDLAETWMEQARWALLAGDRAGARRTAGRAARAFDRFGSPAWAARARLVALEAGLMDAATGGSPARHRSLLAEARQVAAGASPGARALLAIACLQAGLPAEASAVLGPPPTGPRPLSEELRCALARSRVRAALGRRRAAEVTLARAADTLARHRAGHPDLEARTALALHGYALLDLDVELALQSGSAAAVHRATERWRSVARRMPAVSPTGDAPPPLLSHAVLRPAPLGEVRAALRARGLGLVSVFRHRGEVLGVTIGDGPERVLRLGAESTWRELGARAASDVLALTRCSTPAMGRVVRHALGATMDALGALLGPAVPAGPGGVIVVPPAFLGPVPWRLLPGLTGRRLVVSPAASAWLSRATSPAADPLGAITVFAGPGLARAADEATAVASAHGGTPLLGGDAVGPALLDALARPGIVHVAAHGSHAEQNPLFSAIHLADGPTYAHAVQRVGVRAGLVVLSACDVGRAQPRPGEESLGLTAALLACGGRTVVAAPGPVRDATAADVMTALHHHLLAGLDVPAALEASASDDPATRLFCAHGA